MLKSAAVVIFASVVPVVSVVASTPQGRVVEVQTSKPAAPKNKAPGPQEAKPTQLIQVVALQYTRASEVENVLKKQLGLRSRRRGGMVLTPHLEANALLLSGSKEQVTQALDAIARIDVEPALHSAKAITQIVTLEYGSATEVARTLNRFLETKDCDDLRIEPHAPNNMVLLRGTKERIKDALELIARLDAKPAKAKSKPKWVVLEHTRAAEVVPTLIRFLDLAKNAGPNRGLVIDANKERNAVVLRGTAEQTKQAIELIAQIDFAAGKKIGQKAKGAKVR